MGGKNNDRRFLDPFVRHHRFVWVLADEQLDRFLNRMGVTRIYQREEDQGSCVKLYHFFLPTLTSTQISTVEVTLGIYSFKLAIFTTRKKTVDNAFIMRYNSHVA